MSRFIRLGRDYINLSNILRFEVTEITGPKPWKVNMYLREHTIDGTFVLGGGGFKGYNKFYYWNFDNDLYPLIPNKSYYLQLFHNSIFQLKNYTKLSNTIEQMLNLHLIKKEKMITKKLY